MASIGPESSTIIRSSSTQDPGNPLILCIVLFVATNMLGSKIDEVNNARIINNIIKTKKFLNPGIATNNPAASPAEVVAVVSKIV